MYNELIAGQSRLAVIGLGYVGLPIALAFARKIPVIGFDIDENRLSLLQKGIDPGGELAGEAFANTDIVFTSNPEELRTAGFFIIAVPTPIDRHNKPDLSPLLSATRTVAGVLKKGDYVVYESTVYPGCTEEDCVPLLEQLSGLKAGVDFKVGYSPERINPGDQVHTLTNTVKIVSGCDTEALDQIARVYELVIEAGVHRAPDIRVAEAAKIIENTQRDVNIALMNELSIIFSRMGINTYDVLEAAGTKWNFLKFYPGLVGGHCIGVDPYYLEHKANELRYHTQLISAGRFVNDSMGGYIGKKVAKKLVSLGKDLRNSRVLVMGITFKENVSDIRNSKAADIVKELKDYGISVDVVDPRADSHEVDNTYGFPLAERPQGPYDAVVVAVAHKEYRRMSEEDLDPLTRQPAAIFDIKGLYRGAIVRHAYWSL